MGTIGLERFKIQGNHLLNGNVLEKVPVNSSGTPNSIPIAVGNSSQ